MLNALRNGAHARYAIKAFLRNPTSDKALPRTWAVAVQRKTQYQCDRPAQNQLNKTILVFPAST
jgi:hypothetical protein